MTTDERDPELEPATTTTQAVKTAVPASELHDAAARGDVARIKELLASSDHSAVERDVNGATPFYTAAEHGHLEAVKFLASVDAQWRAHKSPIHVVAAFGFTDVLSFLLAEGVDIELPEAVGLTPLCVAAVRGEVGSVTTLIAAGANVNATTPMADNYSIMHYCAELGREEIMKILLAHGADIDACTGVGHSPLSVAAIHGRVEVLSLLIEHGADPLAASAGKLFLPHLAATGGQLAVLQFLVQNGLTRDFERDAGGVTPLSLAAAAGHVSVLEFLLDFQDSSGTSELVKTVQRTDALNSGIEGEHLAIVTLLCERGGARIDALDSDGMTVLHKAAAMRFVAFIEYLLAKHLVSVHARTVSGLTPLMFAAIAGSAVIVDMLLAHGASVDEVIENSPNPELNGTASVHFAALYAHVHVLETLLQHGANVNATSCEGTSVLDCARDCDDVDAIPQIVDFLLAHGAVDA